MGGLTQDVRYGLRMLRRSPGFTLVAVLTLALGIGANTAISSLIDGILVRSLPFNDPQRLVRLTDDYPKGAFVFLRQQSRTMEVATFTSGELNLTGQGEAIRLLGTSVSANFFSLLGVPLERGREFDFGEDQPGRDRLVILSHALWQNRFGGDPAIIGRSIMLEDQSRQVIGIMPPGFHFPSSDVQLWMPLSLDSRKRGDYWGPEIDVIGRLRPGATIAQASNELRSFIPQIQKIFPYPMAAAWNSDAAVVGLREDLVGDTRPKLLIELGAAALVLLIACVNVAGLLLARSIARGKEMAIRTALGASRLRIVRQLLSETVLLAVTGGGIGVALAFLAVDPLKAVLPADTPGLGTITINMRVLAFAAVTAVVAGLLSGVAPALGAPKAEPFQSLKMRSQRSMGALEGRLREFLVIAEIALAVVLLIAAGLTVRSLALLMRVNPGFRPDHLLSLKVSPNTSLCTARAHCVALYDNLVQQAREIPGVLDAAVINSPPLSAGLPNIPVVVEGHPAPPQAVEPMFWAGAVTAGYFRTMGIPLLAGRGISSEDSANSAPAVVVSAATAKRFWPGQNAIGKHLRPIWDKDWRTVVGVVGDIRQYDLTGSSPDWISGSVYMPYSQSVIGNRSLPTEMTLVVRATSNSQGIGKKLRDLAVQLNPNVPIGPVQTLDEVLSASLSQPRAITWPLVTFAALAFLLAAIGIYGLVSYSVAERTPEIGVRMALGAQPRDVSRMVLTGGLRLAVLGVGCGIIAGIALTRVMSSVLYGVTSTDPLTLTTVGILLGIVALAACYIPARRAAKVDPIVALRYE